MNIAPGTMLGPYEIRAPLGAGGMGEVYRAHDKRLRRDVALKVLSPDLLRDELKRRRFADEAQAASALNHPNIVSIFDVSLESIPPYIVSELVEGETLGEVTGGKPMNLRRVLDIALQVADGMATAHQAGIVHRDLKPQNIMVRPDGRVKILDFGLAKHVRETKTSSSEDQETEAMSLTAEGVVVGTAYYMSPEQARGKSVDKRSDIFSFGIILYEMLSGKRPFGGESRIDTLSSIVRDDPPPVEASIPMPVHWTLERCLAKDPAERYESTRDLYNDLRKQREHFDKMSSSEAVTTVAKPALSRRRWLPGALLITGILTGFLLAAFLSTPVPPALQASQFHPIASTGATDDPAAAWSPDGMTIAYPAQVDGQSQIFIRSLESTSPLQVTHCRRGCGFPVWSADGSHLFFMMERAIWSVGAAGGEPQMVVQAADRFALSRDGQTLAFVHHEYPSFHVWLSSPPGAAPVRYSPAPFEASDFNGTRLAFSPDGRKLLLWVNMESVRRDSEFWLLPLPPGSGQPHRVLQSLANSFVVRGLSWMPDNRRVVLACVMPPDVYRSHLYIATVEKDRVDPLVTGIGREDFPDVSRDGKRLAYSAMDVDYNIIEIPLDRSPVRDLLATNRTEHSPAWSPRAKEFAYVTDRRGADEIWVKAPESGWDKPLVTQLSFPDGGTKILDSPAFSPLGDRIAFRAARSIWIVSAAGGAPVRLTNLGDMEESMPTWSPDGNWIAFFAQGKQVMLMKARVGGREPAVQVLENKSYDSKCTPDWSPKGDWIAYYQDGSTVLVSPDGRTTRKVRAQAFDAKAWSRDGALLYGLANEGGKETLFALDVASGKEKRITEIGPGVRPATLWYPGLRLSLSPDGKALAVGSRRVNADIWMLGDFDQTSGLLARLGLRRPAARN